MKKILLIKIDGKLLNLALEKLKKYYLDQEYEVYEDYKTAPQVDKIFVSCIFTENRDQCKYWEDKAIIGGSGWDFDQDENGRLIQVHNTKLPDEIENIKPRINWGFTTRGCIRNCEFCVVPRKEGIIRPIGDIYDIWDGKNDTITIMDNNILALKKHFFKITDQILKENLKVDFNQGLDIRLLTEDIAQRLGEIRGIDYRFAFDSLDVKEAVLKGIPLLQKNGINAAFWYVYCNEDFDSAMERLLILKKFKQRPYLMRDKRVRDIKKFTLLSGWVNSMVYIHTMTFEDYIKRKETKRLEELQENTSLLF